MSIGSQVMVDSTLRYIPAMKHYSTRDFATLTVSAIVAFGITYWVLDVELVVAVAWVGGFTIVALVVMFLRSKGSR
jgi:heme A synthase